MHGVGKPGTKRRLGAAGTLLSLTLAFGAVDLDAARLYRAADAQARATYAAAARVASDLRLFYELRFGLEELKAEATAPAPPAGKVSAAAARCSATVAVPSP